MPRMTSSAGEVPQVRTGMSRVASRDVAVVIPCRNEEATIGDVVRRLREILPDAEMVVVDNGSSDATAGEAAGAGARVVSESRRGKGFALLTGLEAARDADYYVMIDGDDTYPASEVERLLATAAETGSDMVVGTRLASSQPGAFRPGHALGNRFFVWLVRLLFGIRTDDLFSGYRVLTRRFLRAAPLVSEGFDMEAELSIRAHVQGFRVAEVPVEYRARRAASSSKLRTFHDGYRILRGVMILFRDYRPLAFFGWLGVALLLLSLWSGRAPVEDYFRTGLVHFLPRAVLAAALAIIAVLSFALGVLLSSINRRAAELAALIRKRQS
jgi:glycosyltransferase involved in cell wall biosynthesis